MGVGLVGEFHLLWGANGWKKARREETGRREMGEREVRGL